MKKIKQFSLKATLLTIVAALTIGFTGCSDELSGDQTQGKPGYLTLNLKTLKPKQTKTSADLTLDYQKIKDLNVFIFRGDDLILSKYITTQDDGTTALADVNNTVNIRVGELAITDSVVVVANYGSAIDVSTKTDLQNETIPTIGDFSSTGLCMTGINNVSVDAAFTYSTEVRIAPVTSKISVKFATSGDAANYDITGIYVVNAVNSTKLPLVLAGGTNRGITSLLTPALKTVSSGIEVTNAMAIAGNYNIYAHTPNTTTGILSDENVGGLTAGTIYSYYIGENYHAALPTGAGSLFDQSTTDNTNANTLILIKAEPKSTAPQWMQDAGTKYYTYDLSAGIASTTGVASPNAISGAATDGFSTKRKTNYVLTFNLTSVGTTIPFQRMGNLAVTVIADPWDPATTGVIF